MALGHTDQGNAKTAWATPAATTHSSTTFAPAVGSFLTFMVGLAISDAAAHSTVTGVADSGFTTGGWSEAVTHVTDDGAALSLRMSIWTATVTVSASGHAVATRTAGANNGVWFSQVDEWTGCGGIGLVGKADDARVTGASLTVEFTGGTPAGTSAAIGHVFDNNGASNTTTPPNDWSETADDTDVTFGGVYSSDFLFGGPPVIPPVTWTSLQAGTFGKMAVAAEVKVSAFSAREQEGYRFRADDGSETTANWIGSQETDISRAQLVPARLRVLSNYTGLGIPEQVKLQYRAVGGPEWLDMGVI